ncbi:hypothetical protein [Imhoffiella purpurea]|uniref:Uncharacterized protein n=1 Tax=Imhoffiella purpurea TaxID=1249627 RepID=W9VG34_9GAMM|nr:hypothetical protein [Imhoffiella purpurea]EXJ15956.1 hypothetical protein D779_0704 [Imhoffiella purpurea]
MKAYALVVCATLAILASSAFAAPQWYVGYTFVYSESGNSCAFMRFRGDTYSLDEADVLYALFADRIVERVGTTSAFSHVLPSEALAEGKSGEETAAAFLAEGVGACEVAGEPVSGLVYVSGFGCEYQNESQMCIRSYVDVGDRDLSGQGIASGPAVLGGVFVKRPVWDASAALVQAGGAEVPYALDSSLGQAADAMFLVTD